MDIQAKKTELSSELQKAVNQRFDLNAKIKKLEKQLKELEKLEAKANDILNG